MKLQSGLTRWGGASLALVALAILGAIAFTANASAVVETKPGAKGKPGVAGSSGLSTHDHHAVGLAIWAVVVLLFLILLLLELSAAPRKSGTKYGFLDGIIGVDGRTSTSKTVVFVWTLELAAALILLAGIVVWDRNPAITADLVFGTGDWNAYFLLLGGPFAAAVIAKGITASTAAADPTAKPSTTDASRSPSSTASSGGTAALSDLTSNDDGSTSLVDTQYVVFSLIAMAYFFGAFIGKVVDYSNTHDVTKVQLGLPAIPSALLGLTSLAALTYVGNKAAATQGVRLSQLNPPTVPKSQPVTATVVNMPAAATPGNVIVTCTTGDGQGGNLQTFAPLDVQPATGTITFTAPNAAGTWQVVIHTVDYSTPALTLKVT